MKKTETPATPNRAYPKVKVRGETGLTTILEKTEVFILKVVRSLSIGTHSFQKVSAGTGHTLSGVDVTEVDSGRPPLSSNSKLLKGKSDEGALDDDKPKNVRASPVLRPRAVLSSPDNDEMIGDINSKLMERPPSLKPQDSKSHNTTKAVKSGTCSKGVKNTSSNVASQKHEPIARRSSVPTQKLPETRPTTPPQRVHVTRPVTPIPRSHVTGPVTPIPRSPITRTVTPTPRSPVSRPVTPTQQSPSFTLAPKSPVSRPVTPTSSSPLTRPVTPVPRSCVTRPVTPTPRSPITKPVTPTPRSPITKPFTPTPRSPITRPLMSAPKSPLARSVVPAPRSPITRPVTSTHKLPVRNEMTTNGKVKLQMLVGA